MPLLPSSYRAPAYLLGSGHLQTIVPAVLRRVPDLAYRRERIELPDGDFLTLDWADAAGPTPRPAASSPSSPTAWRAAPGGPTSAAWRGR